MRSAYSYARRKVRREIRRSCYSYSRNNTVKMKSTKTSDGDIMIGICAIIGFLIFIGWLFSY